MYSCWSKTTNPDLKKEKKNKKLSKKLGDWLLTVAMWLMWADESNKNTHEREVKSESWEMRWDEESQCIESIKMAGSKFSIFIWYSSHLCAFGPAPISLLSLFLPYWNQSQRKEEEEKATSQSNLYAWMWKLIVRNL